MVLRKYNEGNKPRRGKPFEKGNQYFKNRKDQRKSMVDKGHSISDEGEVIAPPPQTLHQENLNAEKPAIESTHEVVMNTTGEILKESTNESFNEENIGHSVQEKLVLKESIDFFNGPNKLSIRLSEKTINRVHRIQIFLNDTIEIRPVSYAGGRAGYAVWNLLKGSMQK